MIMDVFAHLREAESALQSLLKDHDMLRKISEASGVMIECLRLRGRIFSCGNGGSMCDAMHFAEELSGRYREDRAPLAALAISDPSHLSCVSNDYGYQWVFSRYLEAHGREGDVLLAISTSGNSENVCNAAESARSMGVKVIGLTGRPDCILAKYSDILVSTPGGEYADRVQELHIKVIHIWIDLIERGYFGAR